MIRTLTRKVAIVVTLLATTFGGVAVATPAQAATTRVIFSHSGYSDWRSSVRAVNKNHALKIVMVVKCRTRNYGYNFALVSWNGKPGFDYDSYWLDLSGSSGTVTTRLYPDVKYGYLKIATQANCRVTVTGTQRY
jgi:hypothetical protein